MFTFIDDVVRLILVFGFLLAGGSFVWLVRYCHRARLVSRSKRETSREMLFRGMEILAIGLGLCCFSLAIGLYIDSVIPAMIALFLVGVSMPVGLSYAKRSGLMG